MSSSVPNRISSPPWLQLIQWIRDPLGFQDKYSQQYGDIFTMHLGGLGSMVLIGNPTAIKEIFSKDNQFDSGQANALAEPIVGRNSLMLLDGQRHRRERKLLMPPFHGERLQDYAMKICQITEHFSEQWPIDRPFEARAAMQKISLEVILQIVFGLSAGGRYNQLKPLLTDLLNMTDSPLRSSLLFFKFLQKDWGSWSPWGKLKQHQHQIHQLLQAEIDERRGQPDLERKDILSLMMAVRDEQGQVMSDEEIRDELLTLLFAGHETTATTLAWAIYQLHQNLGCRDQLLKELNSIDQHLSPMEIAQLPYLSAVCQETLRMYPVIPILFPRMVKTPVDIGGYQFEAQTVLMPSMYLVHYREDLYPNAQKFRPERFLEHQYSSSEYFPFGGGSRRCLGYALAQIEMKLILATMLSKHQLVLAEKEKVIPQRRGFTLSPKGGVQLIVTS